MIDLSDVLMDHLWLVIGVVIATSLLLLLLAFRSVVVPVKAALVNLLSVGAAYGVMTLAFQTETGAGLLGLPGEVPIAAYVPLLMFAVLFGLSMDYEVFLLSSVREAFLRTGDSQSQRRRGTRVDGAGHHLRGTDHGRRVPRLRLRPQRGDQDDRGRHGRRDRHRRHPDPADRRAGDDGAAGPVQLVPPLVAGTAASRRSTRTARRHPVETPKELQPVA